ncbi:MAG: hypothetical protein WCT27_04465 [Patescibacteria group bacterium]
MSSENKSTIFTFTRSQNAVLFGAGIIFIVVVGVALVSFFYGKRQGSQSLAAVPGTSVAPAGYQKILGIQTASWQGKISQVTGKNIVFTFTDIENKSKKLTARVTEDTQLLRTDITATPTSNSLSGSRTIASLADFKPGATIYVQGPNSDSGQTTFDAIAITLLIIPNN